MNYTPQQALPHRGAMVLLDEVLDWSAEHAQCALTIRPSSPFFEAGRVPGWVGIEYMAQCIGVWAGIQRLEAGLPVIIGLLLGSRSYEVPADFAAGEQLVVRAGLLVRDDSGVGVFDCTIMRDDRLLARADVKAFQPDDIRAYLQSLSEDAA